MVCSEALDGYLSIPISVWIKNATQTLRKADIKSARLDSSLLLENRLKKSHDWVIAHNDELLTETQIVLLNKDIAQRVSRIPLAYIIGSKEFYGRDFMVSKDVLIPRPESEAMIELLKQIVIPEPIRTPDNSWALGQFKRSESLIILDVGTGSGILAITAQLELPKSTVVATDISKNALEVAKQNATCLKAPVQFYEANLLDIPVSIKPDVILANLPYVPENLITSEEITKEPNLALFSGTDGLNHYRIFWGQVINLPFKPAVIITEGLKNQHPQLAELAIKAGYKLEKTDTLAQLFVLN